MTNLSEYANPLVGLELITQPDADYEYFELNDYPTKADFLAAVADKFKIDPNELDESKLQVIEYNEIPFEPDTVKDLDEYYFVWLNWDPQRKDINQRKRKAFLVYIAMVGGGFEFQTIQNFERDFVGHYDTPEDFVEELVENTGFLKLMEAQFGSRNYFNYTAYWESLMGTDYFYEENFIFRNQ